MADTLSPARAVRLGLDTAHIDSATVELLAAPPDERRVARLLVNRSICDAAFRAQVLAAYDDRRAVTGLRIVNGGGRAEAQAAHIWAVADGGLDVVQNGLALSATAHWLFDRHLISLDADLGLLLSPNRVPAEFIRLFSPPGERTRLPEDARLHPRFDYVARHRAKFADLGP